MKFAEYINEKKIDISNVIKVFRKAGLIVKMPEYNTLVGRMSQQEAEDVMDQFNFDYKINQGTKDKELVYIELKGTK